ncbi:MAG: hypothetical protein KDC35_04490 [Acidobacteria bacterium]|nr:hypothetical protein [Acidobacteriota bacterium]
MWLLCLFLQVPSPKESSVQELRDVVGTWQVTTEFLNGDGSVAATFQGTYEFEWVIEDHVLSGKTSIPELEMVSAILFYVNERDIQMVSVGKDGKLWIMTGPLGGDTRMTEPYQSEDGTTRQLRFTRFNVTADQFESRMEITSDGGNTWLPGNHQVFKRAD